MLSHSRHLRCMVMRPQTDTIAKIRLAAPSGANTQRLRPDIRSVLSLDRVKEVPISKIQPILNQQLQQHGCDQKSN